MPDKKPDQYDEKADRFILAQCRVPWGKEWHEVTAAFGRQCAEEARREAFLEAAKILEKAGYEDCYCAQHSKYPEGVCLIKARASSSGKTGERE